MQLYGYCKSTDEMDSDPDYEPELLVLTEVTVAASSATLRRLAQFLVYAADKMDRHGAAFGHEHFGFYARDVGSAPEFIVARVPDGTS